MADTATETRPLTADEQATLNKLLVRASADKTPATRIGEPYEALIALSVPRRGDAKDKQTDLVMPGETVYLTEEEARAFERHGGRDGRQVPVIRKLSGPDGSREPLPQLLPRHVSGRLFRPPPPPPGSDAPRPDPEGSSRVQVLEDGRAPETAGAMSADPSEMADQLRSAAAPDAIDLPPSRSRARGGR
jgi:hypothetical protein